MLPYLNRKEDEEMRDILLTGAMLIMFGWGYHLMTKMDCFREENKKIQNEEKEEPPEDEENMV